MKSFTLGVIVGMAIMAVSAWAYYWDPDLSPSENLNLEQQEQIQQQQLQQQQEQTDILRQQQFNNPC